MSEFGLPELWDYPLLSDDGLDVDVLGEPFNADDAVVDMSLEHNVEGADDIVSDALAELGIGDADYVSLSASDEFGANPLVSPVAKRARRSTVDEDEEPFGELPPELYSGVGDAVSPFVHMSVPTLLEPPPPDEYLQATRSDLFSSDEESHSDDEIPPEGIEPTPVTRHFHETDPEKQIHVWSMDVYDMPPEEREAAIRERERKQEANREKILRNYYHVMVKSTRKDTRVHRIMCRCQEDYKTIVRYAARKKMEATVDPRYVGDCCQKLAMGLSLLLQLSWNMVDDMSHADTLMVAEFDRVLSKPEHSLSASSWNARASLNCTPGMRYIIFSDLTKLFKTWIRAYIEQGAHPFDDLPSIRDVIIPVLELISPHRVCRDAQSIFVRTIFELLLTTPIDICTMNMPEISLNFMESVGSNYAPILNVVETILTRVSAGKEYDLAVTSMHFGGSIKRCGLVACIVTSMGLCHENAAHGISFKKRVY